MQQSLSFKLERALDHLHSVEGAVAEDIATYSDSPIVKADGKETLDLPNPSPMISVFAGEFIYQLRSALDHLAFDLVKVNRGGSLLPLDWEDYCQFPIWCDPLKPGDAVPLSYGRFKNLPGIPHQAHTIIESVQPYYPANRRATTANTSLGLLNKLSNIDKHRRLALTRTRARVHHHIVYESGVTGQSVVTLDHGAEIPPPDDWKEDPIVNVQRSMLLTIAFDERSALGDATTVSVDHLLQLIMDGVMLSVIAPLKPFLS